MLITTLKIYLPKLFYKVKCCSMHCEISHDHDKKKINDHFSSGTVNLQHVKCTSEWAEWLG